MGWNFFTQFSPVDPFENELYEETIKSFSSKNAILALQSCLNKNTNRPHSSGEEQDSKLGSSLTLKYFGIKACDQAQLHSVGSGANDYV